jgi:hypothetical protein
MNEIDELIMYDIQLYSNIRRRVVTTNETDLMRSLPFKTMIFVLPPTSVSIATPCAFATFDAINGIIEQIQEPIMEQSSRCVYMSVHLHICAATYSVRGSLG